MHRKTASVPLALKPRTTNAAPSKQLSGRSNISPDLYLYSNFSEPQSNKASKFFTNNSNNVSKSTIIKTTDPPTVPIWEINERLDSFKFRSQKQPSQKLTFELLQKDFIHWEKTSTEINKILNHFSSDLSEVTSAIHFYNKKVYMEMFEFCKMSLQKSKKKVDKYKMSIALLNAEVFKLNKHIAEINLVQFRDNEKIEAEIKEIFGDFVIDTEEIRKKFKELKDENRIPAADVLKDLLEKLPLTEKVPDHETASPIAFDIRDYELILNTRIKNVQVSTAQKIIKYFENKDNLTNKFTQTHEQLTELKNYLETKESLDKVTFQLGNTTQQLEKAWTKITDCENRIDTLIEEKGKLITENLLKNNEIQNFREKEKILKQKILALKTEENSASMASPYMKESKPDSPKFKESVGFYTRNDLPDYRKELEIKYTEDDAESEEKSIEEHVYNIPSGKGSSFRESRTSLYSSAKSKSSFKDEDLNNENYEDEKFEEEKEKPGQEKNEEEKSDDEQSEEENDLSHQRKENRGSRAKVEKKKRGTQGTTENKKIVVSSNRGVKKVFTSNEVENAIKEASKKFERKVTGIDLNDNKSAPPVYRSRPSGVITEQKKEIIRPEKMENIKSGEKREKSVRFTEPPAPEKPKRNNIMGESKHNKTTSAMFPSSNEISPIEDYDQSHSIPKEESKMQNLIKGEKKRSISESSPKLHQSEKSSSPVPKFPKPSPISKPIAKDKKKSLTSIPKPILPNINKSKPEKTPNNPFDPSQISIEKLKIHIKELESALKSMKDTTETGINTDPMPGTVETQDFSSQFGFESTQKPKDPLIYMSPYNPNNLYGLKADRYFTSKGVFSAQPQIPDLNSSALFNQPYHMSYDTSS